MELNITTTLFSKHVSMEIERESEKREAMRVIQV